MRFEQKRGYDLSTFRNHDFLTIKPEKLLFSLQDAHIKKVNEKSKKRWEALKNR